MWRYLISLNTDIYKTTSLLAQRRMHFALTIPEIFLEILSIHLLDENDRPDRYYTKLMTIASCCKTWKNIIWESPILWRYVIFDGKKIRRKFMLDAMVRAALIPNRKKPGRRRGRAQDICCAEDLLPIMPCHVILVARSKRREHVRFVLEIVDLYWDRIESVTIVSARFWGDDVYTKYFLHAKPLPNLKRIDYMYFGNPNLKRLDGSSTWSTRPVDKINLGVDGLVWITRDMESGHEDHLCHPCVTNVSICGALYLTDVIYILQTHIILDVKTVTKCTMIKVQEQVAIGVISSLVNLIDLEIVDGLSPFVSSEEIVLPKLKYLAVDRMHEWGQFVSIPLILLYVRAPVLTHLRLSLDQRAITDALDMSLVSNWISRLEKLEIKCSVTHTLVDKIFEVIPTGCDVHAVCTSTKRFCRCASTVESHRRMTIETCR